MTDQMTSTPDRRVIQCNYRKPTNVAAEGARAYLMLDNRGNANDRIMVLVRSRGKRWVAKWENMAYLHNFRMKTIPYQHPLYQDHRIWYFRGSDEHAYLSRMVDELNEAADRERPISLDYDRLVAELLAPPTTPCMACGHIGVRLGTRLCEECLARPYGARGEPLEPERCRPCWGEFHVWYGNAWGLQHTPPGLSGCPCVCHVGEVWLA